MISTIYCNYYLDEFKSEFQRNADAGINSLSSQIGKIMERVEDLSLQMSFIPGLNMALRDPAHIDVYEYSQLKENIRNQIATDSLFYSAYIYFKLDNKILTSNEGIYDLSTFYDSDFIKKIVENKIKTRWFAARSIEDGIGSPPIDVITFNREIPITEIYPMGYLVINIKKDVFFNVLNKLDGENKTSMFVFDENKNLLFYNSMGAKLSKQLAEYVSTKQIHESDGMRVEKIGQKKYFLVYRRLQYNDWGIIDMLPYDDYTALIYTKLLQLLKVALSVLVFGFITAYLFSLAMYSPLKKIITNLMEYLNNKSGGCEKNDKCDEYSLVGDTINNLISENSSIKMLIEQNKPIIRDKIINDILNGNILESESIERKLQGIEINFPYPGFIVVIVAADIKEYEQENNYNSIKLAIFSHIESMLQETFNVLGTILEDDKYGFIININSQGTDSGIKELIFKRCTYVNDIMQNELDMTLQFFISNVYESITLLNKAYLNLKKVMNYKAIIDKKDIVFVDDIKSDCRIEYPLLIQKQLLNSIKCSDSRSAHEAISALFNSYIYLGKFSYDKLQQMLLVLLSSVIGDLMQDRYDIRIIDEADITRINSCQNNEELRKSVTDFADRLIALFNSRNEQKVNNIYIQKAVGFIVENYRNNISVSDIADFLGVSCSYLSRIFKAEMGKSPLEYINEYRIEMSKKLLKSNDYTLTKISSIVGYNDVHSFIRFFKKYEALTPSEYRKSIIGTENF